MSSIPAIPALLLVPDESQSDYSALYAIATTYAHSGLLISQYGEKSGCPTYSFPAIVCSSFAIELFLKFFLMLKRVRSNPADQRPERGHRIGDLWADLAPEHQALIAGMHRNKTGVPLLNASDLRIKLFVEVLNEVGDAPFIRWRYAHELKDTTLMSHGAVAEVVDALGHAAEYAMKEQSVTFSSNTVLQSDAP